MNRIKSIQVDLNGRDEKLVVINAKRGDSLRSLNISILSNGENADISDVTKVQFGCKKPNKEKKLRDINKDFIDKNNHAVFVMLEPSDIDVAGITECELILTNEYGFITSGTFYINVFPLAIDGSEIMESEEMRTFEDMIGRLINYSAKDISFDNSQNGLTSTNVQDAYDEMKEKYDNLNALYNQVFREVDNHRLKLIDILNKKNVTVLSTEELVTLPSYTKQIKGLTPNIYIQNEEPTEKKGIWLQRANGWFPYKLYVFSTSYEDTSGEDSVIIKKAKVEKDNLYFTELFTCDEETFPSFKTGFIEASYQINGIKYLCNTYYGDGEKWIQIINPATYKG